MGDAINPDHYRFGSNGAEVIDLTEHLDFLSGNAVKYLCRAGRKSSSPRLEDARKAKWYVDRLVEKLTREQSASEPKKINVTIPEYVPGVIPGTQLLGPPLINKVTCGG